MHNALVFECAQLVDVKFVHGEIPRLGATVDAGGPGHHGNFEVFFFYIGEYADEQDKFNAKGPLAWRLKERSYPVWQTPL
jgi:hypothetical protein